MMDDNSDMNSTDHAQITLRRLGIDTHQEPTIYMQAEAPVCKSEGFEAQSRLMVEAGSKSVIATLNLVTSDLLEPDEAGLSEAAWRHLGEPADDTVGRLTHARPVSSLGYVRSKIYGNPLDPAKYRKIIADIVAGRYADVHLAAFITACSGGRMSDDEVVALTQAMTEAGETLEWDQSPVLDKHCVGGLPGNRTTPILVSIVAAFGLTMPKTSSRAITSPAGTADTMETLAPVDLTLPEIRRVVEKEGGCIAWGGAVNLSPADDVLIRVQRALDLDSSSQLVASVLSKKAAAGSSHIVIDIPVGPTAKIRSKSAADEIARVMSVVGDALDLHIHTVQTDGTQPVGRGLGPSLEARDVLAVLQNKDDAPQDLRDRALKLAAHVIELTEEVSAGNGIRHATEVLDSGRAWEKFQAICEAQGGMREPPTSTQRHEVTAERGGIVASVDNRLLARTAKLAGAPADKAAGLDFLAPPGTEVESGQPLFRLHADNPGELDYALDFVKAHPNIVKIRDKD
ncbi:MAG: thymidine phosphorylase family protein [Myxococcota bacterium]